MSNRTGIMNSVQNANNENLDTLFPGGKRPDIVPNTYITDFLTSVRTRESRSSINLAGINYNRWEIFPRDGKPVESHFTFYTDIKN